jgi:peptide deformylase
MAVREVLRYPHASLKQVARALEPERDESLIERVLGDLVHTMGAHPGCIGLAAPQLDELVRIVVVDATGHPRAQTCNGLLRLINPEIVRATGAEVGREGCLSIPDLTANVRRATEIVVGALDASGERVEVSSAGFEARCLAHEIDHLDGILFLDRVDSLKTDVFRRNRYQ